MIYDDRKLNNEFIEKYNELLFFNFFRNIFYF